METLVSQQVVFPFFKNPDLFADILGELRQLLYVTLQQTASADYKEEKKIDWVTHRDEFRRITLEITQLLDSWDRVREEMEGQEEKAYNLITP